jgi:hypothetical protein
MMTIYADREDPPWSIAWSDGQGVLRDFSGPYAFRVEFLTTRTKRVFYTKTEGIAGADTSPNIVVSWAVGELADKVGKFKLRLVARNTVTNRESVFREGSLPSLLVLAPPTSG